MSKYNADGLLKDFVKAIESKSAQQLADVYRMAKDYLRSKTK